MTQSDRAIAAAESVVPRIDPTTVTGWGVDADPENDPTWPMRDRSGEDGAGMDWTRPPLQDPGAEILRSVEHDGLTASVGTSTPPRGLSGALRRQAFKFSEGQWGHWLILMLADRVNSIEGLIQDVGQGRMPNPLVEMGMVPQSRSREAALGTAAVVVGFTAAAVVLLRRRR